MSPFSAGTVRISPRAWNAARTPDGESAGALSFEATLTYRGRVCGRSVVTRTGTGVDCPLD